MTKQTLDQDATMQILTPLQAAHDKDMLRLQKEHEQAAKRRQRVEDRLDYKFSQLKDRLASCPDPGALSVNSHKWPSGGLLGALRSILL